MDKPARAQQLRFAPDRRLTAATGVGAFVAVVAAVLTTDAPGRLLAAVAAVVLFAYAAADLAFTPRLVADAGGLVVRSPAVRAALPWPVVEDVRADARIRFGLRGTTLEIDAGETLVVLTRRALGARPEDVAELVNALRPR